MSKTALFIEPDAEILEFVRTILERENFTVYHAQDGCTALKLAFGHRPDVILSTHSVPYGTGLEVLKTIRAHQHIHPTPFIFVSSNHPDSTLCQQYARHGADASISMPFSSTNLMSTVYDVLKKTSPSDP